MMKHIYIQHRSDSEILCYAGKARLTSARYAKFFRYWSEQMGLRVVTFDTYQGLQAR